ncbi:MAG: lipocalin-like domain-containing protein [Acidobacteria bacterium]|nr:lipocalin-like domain-containing protein [Acidobacteriota bacterium]
MKALTTLFVAGMFVTTLAMADDVDDVKATIRGHFAAVNSGDVAAYTPYYANQGSAFGGGELLERLSVEQRTNNFQAGVDRGLRRNLQMRNLEVQIYGNVAIATGYLLGSTTAPDGTTQRTSQQRTGVLIKQGGQWKEVHRHNSPLTVSTPQIEDRFVGTWKLASFERRGPDGELGSSANSYRNGLLVYTPTGHMSLQLTRENRQQFEGRASPEEAQAALYSYIAYYGTFTVNQTQGAVIHHRQGHLIPDRVTEGMRYFRFSGNRLMLTAPPTGGGMVTTLTWERIE